MGTRSQIPIALMPLPIYGLNDKFDAYHIDPQEAAEIENIEIDKQSAISRLGYTQYGTTSGSGPIKNGIDYRRSGGTNYLVRSRRDAIEYYKTSNQTWTAISLPITLTANRKVGFAVLNDLLIIDNGLESDIKWDGSVATQIVANPKGDASIVYQNRWVKFNFAESKIYYSDINDPETFDALSYEVIDPNSGAIGTGISELNGQIVIFKENKPYILTQLVGGAIYPLDGQATCISHYSIAKTNRSLIYCGVDGFYELSGTTSKLISGRLDSTKFNQSMLDETHAVFHENKYRCFIAEAGYLYNNLEVVIDTTQGTPFPDNPYPIIKNRGLNGACFIQTLRSGDQKLYFGDSRPDSGSPIVSYSKVYRMFDGLTDDGEDIDAYWISKLFDGGTPFFQKRYRDIYTRVENTTNLTYYTAYRFSQNDAWTEFTLEFPTTDLTWILDDGTEVTDWEEGFAWPVEGTEDNYHAIEQSGQPKTIQFRNRVSENDAQAKWVYQAYRFKQKNKFK